MGRYFCCVSSWVWSLDLVTSARTTFSKIILQPHVLEAWFQNVRVAVSLKLYHSAQLIISTSVAPISVNTEHLHCRRDCSNVHVLPHFHTESNLLIGTITPFYRWVKWSSRRLARQSKVTAQGLGCEPWLTILSAYLTLFSEIGSILVI